MRNQVSGHYSRLNKSKQDNLPRDSGDLEKFRRNEQTLRGASQGLGEGGRARSKTARNSAYLPVDLNQNYKLAPAPGFTPV